MRKIYCNELQPNTHIRIMDDMGNEYEYIIRRLIPIQNPNKNNEISNIRDIEILLDKSRNIYFSYLMYLTGTSWVKEIEILS